MTCNACNRTIYDRLMSQTSPDNKIWHSECLKCCECNKILDSKYFETQGRLYCRNDYLAYFGPSCFACADKITDDQYFFTIKQTISIINPPNGNDLALSHQNQQPQTTTQSNTLFFHDKCFACNYCQRPLQKGEKYCILDSPTTPQKSLIISHEICALKFHSANSNNIQSNSNNAIHVGQPLQANAPPAPRGRRGRMKQERS